MHCRREKTADTFVWVRELNVSSGVNFALVCIVIMATNNMTNTKNPKCVRR